MNIPAELRFLLQIPNDAAAFVMAMFRTFFTPLRTIHNRVVQRTGIASVEIADADPKKAGQERAVITMRDGGADPGRLAARVAIMITQKGKGRLYIDEAARWASGQPVGTTRSLDDGGDEVTPLLVRSLDRRFSAARTLDPITITLIVGVGVPLLVAVIPGLLPMIIEWGKGAFSAITNTPTGPVTGPATPPAEREFGIGAITNPFSDVLGSITGDGGDGDPTNDTRNALIVGAVVVGIVYLALRK